LPLGRRPAGLTFGLSFVVVTRQRLSSTTVILRTRWDWSGSHKMIDRLLLVTYVLAWIIACVNGFALLAGFVAIGRIHLMRSKETYVLTTDDGPTLHEPMPDFLGISTDGIRIDREKLRGRATIMLFISMNCPPCNHLLKDLRGLTPHYFRKYRIVLVVEAPDSQLSESVRRVRFPFTQISDPNNSIRNGLRIERVPFGLHIDGNLLVRTKGIVTNKAQFIGLITHRSRSAKGLSWEETEPSVLPPLNRT